MNKKVSNAPTYATLAILQWMWTLSDDKGCVAIYNIALMLNLLCLMSVCLGEAKLHSQLEQLTCIGMFLSSVIMCVSGLIIVLFHTSYSYHFMFTSIVSLLSAFAIFGTAK